MASITREQILQGGFFTISTPDFIVYCYEVNHLAASGRRPAKWFVRLVTETESFYLGELKAASGEIVLTNASKFSQEDEAFRVAFRVFKAIFTGQSARMEAFGDSIRCGTPNDAHEETPTSQPQDVSTPRSVKIGSLYHFDYDIHGQRFTMDYELLYSRAIQTSESCYYFEGSQVPYPMLDEMWAAGCTANLVRTHDDEIEGLLQRAERQIAKKLAEKEASLEQSLENAVTKLDKELTDDSISPEKARKRYDARIKSAIKSADKLAECYAESAKRYGLRIDLDGVRAASASMAEKAKARAAAYAKAAEKVQGTPFAQAAADGDMPHEVLADVLTDNGDDAAASELVKAFSGDCYDLETSESV